MALNSCFPVVDYVKTWSVLFFLLDFYWGTGFMFKVNINIYVKKGFCNETTFHMSPLQGL